MHNITRITTTIEATQSVAWPHFAGSTLRGAFGRAFRQAACITGQDKCDGCPLRNSCAYGIVFDPAAPAQPLHPSFRDGMPRYIVQPPALGACQMPTGQTQNFDLLLLPGTQAHHGLIKHTLLSAVERELFAPGLFKLLATQSSQIHVLSANTETPEQPNQANAHITLRWLTPLRLQHQGKPVFKAQQLDAHSLVRALLRRQLQWQQISSEKPEASPQKPSGLEVLGHAQACILDTRNLQWHDIQRHSGSQNQKLPLGGLIGSATLSGPSAALHMLLPLLQLGEQLHIGKETVMGLGRYRLSALNKA
jgi:hypothetical protein